LQCAATSCERRCGFRTVDLRCCGDRGGCAGPCGLQTYGVVVVTASKPPRRRMGGAAVGGVDVQILGAPAMETQTTSPSASVT
jgi:hypothetical protein